MSKPVITYKGKKLNFPTSWNELSEKQFVFVAGHIAESMQLEERDIDKENAFKLQVVKLFTGLPWYKFQQLTKDEIADLMSYIDFLFQEFDLNTVPFKKFRHRLRTYHGPDNDFDDLSMGQLSYADTYFIKYIKDRDEEHLNKLLATLYNRRTIINYVKKILRLKQNNFNERNITKKARNFEVVPVEYKLSALYIWWGFRENIMIKTFPNIFPEPNKKEANRVGNNYGWAATVTETAGTKFGDLDKTKEQSWWDIFIYMSMEMDKANAIKNKT